MADKAAAIQLVNDLREEIQKLNDTVERVMRFARLEEDEIGPTHQPEQRLANGHPSKAKSRESRGGRVSQLRKFIEKHGASSRTEILEGTGIPLGSIGALLRNNCKKTADRKWVWKGDVTQKTEGRDKL
jgi:TolA-binding protein